MLLYYILLLCWDWNTGWDDCGREFFIVFLWFSDQDSWVSFWDTAEVKNWRPWQLLCSSCICRCFMMFCWFMLILLYFIQCHWKTLKNIWKHMKTIEHITYERETEPSKFSVIPRYSQPGEVTALCSMMYGIVWPTRSWLLLRSSKAEGHATPISSPARKRLRFEDGEDEEQIADSGRHCIELRGAPGRPCHDKHNSIIWHNDAY